MSLLNSSLFVFALAALVVFSSCAGDDNIATVFDEEVQFETEVALINDYLLENGYDANVTENGVRLVVIESGEDRVVADGELVSFDYTGRFLNRNDDDQVIDTLVFETTIFAVAEEEFNAEENNPVTYKPVTYTFSNNGWTLTSASGSSNFITGFREGVTEILKRMGPGGRGEILIPSREGYGVRGNFPVVPSNQTLIFEIYFREITE